MALFISSFLLAIAFCAPPGVITAETIRRGSAHGFLPALFVQFGSLVGDTTWAIIALTGLAFLVQSDVSKAILSAAGVALMLRLAYTAFQDARQGKGLDAPSLTLHRSDFANGAFLSLGNPLNIVFWTGLGTTAFSSIPGKPQPVHFAVFFAGFLGAAVLWCFLVAGLVAWGRRLLSRTFFRWVNFLCGLALCFFALQLAWNLIKLL